MNGGSVKKHFDDGGSTSDGSSGASLGPSFLSKIGSALGPTPGSDPLFSLAAKYLPLAMLISSLTTKNSNQRPGLPGFATSTGAVPGSAARTPIAGNPASYYTYGQNTPGQDFFQGSQGMPGYSIPGAGGPTASNPGAGTIPGPGGALGMATGGEPGELVSGPGSGRDDKIDAKLSDGEYVMDAETVALLGDGSLEEGAKKLDALREHIRQHKGKSLAKGKFSPKAKDASSYLGSESE